jgi:uncharacterized protein YjbI with pentapeptide repeats
MPDENLIRVNIPQTLRGPIESDSVTKFFLPHSDFTYRKLENLNIFEANLYQSLLTGSLIRHCVFTNVKFQRADLDGVRIETSTFINCDFSKCDFRSSHFTQCKFEKSIFDEAYINDCQFNKCFLSDCSLKGASLTESHLLNTSMINCTLTQGTFIHNWLFESSMSDMAVGDCTFMYVILRDCKFQNITINADSIGTIFGFSEEHLRDAKLMFLGKQEAVPDGSDIINLLAEEYVRRQWYIGQLGLNLNFNRTSTIGAFENYFTDSFPRFSEMGFLKGDEIRFVGDVLEELAALEKLPLLTALNVLKWCSSLKSEINTKTAGEATGDKALNILSNRVRIISTTLIEKIEDAVPEIELNENEMLVHLKITFRERPELPLEEVLNSVGASSKLGIQQRSYFISAKSGSYVEIVFSTLFTVFAFKIFLFLVNGCLIQITEMKERLNILRRKQAPKSYSDLALVPSQQISPTTQMVIQGLLQYAKTLGWLKDPSLLGFEASNVQSLELVKPESVPIDE